ncbi:8307_t:CDS:2 [Paraglomus occultum]|uniref:8307_t:CDS:1 n=1 Tax=Paraglomus occultum TaxID=144539 RepID=A0A9N8Z461_9GLOM|nr:8307_t:CDS:2 [Paraglomus occultum]
MEWGCKCTRCNNPRWEESWGLSHFDEQNLALRLCELFLQAVQNGQDTLKVSCNTKSLCHQDTWSVRIHDTLRTFHSDFVSVEYNSSTSTYVYKWKVETSSSLIDYTLDVASIKMTSLLQIFTEQQKMAVLKLKKLVDEPLSSGNAELALMTDVIRNMKKWFYGFEFVYDVDLQTEDRRDIDEKGCIGLLVLSSRVGILVVIEVRRSTGDNNHRITSREHAKMLKAKIADKYSTKCITTIGAHFTSEMDQPEFLSKQDKMIAQSVSKYYALNISTDNSRKRPKESKAAMHRSWKKDSPNKRAKRTQTVTTLNSLSAPRMLAQGVYESARHKFWKVVQCYKLTATIIGHAIVFTVLAATIILMRGTAHTSRVSSSEFINPL